MATLLRMKLRPSHFLRCFGHLGNQSRPPQPRFPTSNHSTGLPIFLAHRLFSSSRFRLGSDKAIQTEEAELLSPPHYVYSLLRKTKKAGLIYTASDEIFRYMMKKRSIPTNALYRFPQPPLPLPYLMWPRPQYYCDGFFYQDFFADALYVITWKFPNCLLPIHDQEETGLCYAIPFVDCIYTHDCIFGGRNVEPLSMQQFLDHERLFRKNPDKGGYIEEAAAYIKWYGLCTERCFPWLHGAYGSVPHHFASMKRRYIEGVEVLNPDDEVQIQERLLCGNTLYVDVCVSTGMLHGLEGYQGLCSHSPAERAMIQKNPRKYPMHAMVCIGYGETYWIIKNSWGRGCGFFGFYNIDKRDMAGFYQVIL